MKRLCVSLILFVLLQMSLMAQFSIQGRVLDAQSGEGVPGVHLKVSHSYQSVISDARGNFRFRSLPSGDYVLKSSHIAFEVSEINLLLEGDTQLVVRLLPAVIGIPAVEVQATRLEARTPLTYRQMEREEVLKENAAPDLPYLLRLQPSVVVSSDAGHGVGYTGIRIRGTDITRINVTLNGIPLNDPESQGVFWVNMPDLAASTSSILVQRGVGSSANGAAAFGASINIQTLDIQADPYAELQSSAGSFQTFKNSLRFGSGLIDGKYTVDGRLSAIHSAGFIDRATSDLRSFYLSGAYYGTQSVLKLIVMSGKEKTYQAWDGIPSYVLDTNRRWNGIGAYTDADGERKFYENETDNYQQDHYQVHYSRQLNRRLSLNSALFYIRGRGYYEQYKEDQDFADYGLLPVMVGDSLLDHSDLVRQKWLDNHFYGGNASLRYQNRRYNIVAGGEYNVYEGDHFGEIIWARHMPGADINEQWYFNDGLKKQSSVFGRVNYELNPEWQLFADLQYRSISYRIRGIHDDLRDLGREENFQFFNPKGGVFYSLSEAQSLYVSLAISHREPTRSDFRDADPDRLPRQERLTNFELGYQLKKHHFGLNANVFYMDYKDQLILTGAINNVGAPVFTNIPESYRAGIELAAFLRPAEVLEWEATLSLSENKARDFTAWVDDWDTWGQEAEYLGETDLAFSPSILASSLLRYSPFDPLVVEWISQYTGKQYIDNTANAQRQLDAYWVNDLRITWNIPNASFKHLALSLWLRNVLNEEYESNACVYRYDYQDADGQRREGVYDGYFPQAGRHFLFSLNIGI